ncbi:uncharacterized protein LOC130647624 [Hydractinia symbiolongicarpus]|uniref:uncharacterized protein LOC130647624 n=1 Tax=Hydractinia symbiolongicarpus TaxID=13093 RepID=UPI00254DD05C|nr:uncharacterized protein LOC130647624 [Hydractinia symbiolongicarpus]
MTTNSLSETDSINCDQCNASYNSVKIKPVYDKDGIVCGHRCDYCRMENVQNARRCELTKCEQTFGKVLNLRIIPAKFYDLPDGKAKNDIITQFGLTKDTKACCNTCYLRISRAVQKSKIFTAYQKEQLEISVAKESLKNDSSNQNTSNVTGNKSDLLGDKICYSGPQFRRKEGMIPFWLKSKQSDDKKKDNTLAEEKCFKSSKDYDQSDYTEESFFYDQKYETEDNDNFSHDDTYRPPTDCHIKPMTSPPKTRSRRVKKPVRYTQDASNFVVNEDSEYNNIEEDQEHEPKRLVCTTDMNESYEKEETKDMNITEPVNTKNVQLQVNENELDETAMPSQILSDVASCKHCHQVCNSDDVNNTQNSSMEPECSDCQSTKPIVLSCVVRGCTTPPDEVKLQVLPAGYFSLLRIHKRTISLKFGLKKYVKTCCTRCFTLINEAVNECSEMGDLSYTICGSCEHIIPESSLVKCKNKNGKLINVGCYKCCQDGLTTNSGSPQSSMKKLDFIKPPRKHNRGGNRVSAELATFLKDFDKTGKEITGFLADLKLNKSARYNICHVSGCTSQGETAWLYPYGAIIKSTSKAVAMELLRVFRLSEGSDVYCCRDCFTQLKWYAAFLSNEIKSVEPKETPSLQALKRNARILPKPTILVPVSIAQNVGQLRLTTSTTMPAIRIYQQQNSFVTTQPAALCVTSQPTTAFGVTTKPATVQPVPDIQISNVHSVEKQNDHNNITKTMPIVSVSQSRTVSSLASKSSPKYPQVASVFSFTPPASGSRFQAIRLPDDVLLSYPVNVTTSTNSPQRSLQPVPLVTTPQQLLNSQNPILLTARPIQHCLNVIPSPVSASQQQASINLQKMTTTTPPVRSQTAACNMMYNKATLTDAQPVMLDKVCQTGLIYISDSKDQCSSTRLKQPYNEVTDAKLKKAVRKESKEMFDVFLDKLNELSLGCGLELLKEFTHPKEVLHTQHLMTMLEDYGNLYRRTYRHNKQERLRILSSVAGYASNELLRKYFQHYTAKGDLVSVNEDEIKRARDYSNLFGPGIVLPNVELKSGQLLSNNTSSASLTSITTDTLVTSGSPSQMPILVTKCLRTASNVGPSLNDVSLKDESNKKRIEVITIDDPDDPEDQEINSVGNSIFSDVNETKTQPRASNNVAVSNEDVVPKKFNGLPGYFLTPRSKMWINPITETKLVEKIPTIEREEEEKIKCENFQVEEIDVLPLDYDEYPDRALSPVFDLIRSTSKCLAPVAVCSKFSPGVTDLSGKTISNKSVSDNPIFDSDNQSNKVIQRNLEAQNEAVEVKVKRKRTRFSHEEREKLEGFYMEGVLHGKKRKTSEMSAILNIDCKTIRTWFRNRGCKARKEKFEQSLKKASVVANETSLPDPCILEQNSLEEPMDCSDANNTSENELDQGDTCSSQISIETCSHIPKLFMPALRTVDNTAEDAVSPRTTTEFVSTTEIEAYKESKTLYVSSESDVDKTDECNSKLSNVTGVATDITGVVTDVARVTTDVVRVTTDVAETTTDLTGVATDVTEKLPLLECAFDSSFTAKQTRRLHPGHVPTEPPLLTPSPDIFRKRYQESCQTDVTVADSVQN